MLLDVICHRILVFAKLGNLLENMVKSPNNHQDLFGKVKAHNPWFTEDCVVMQLNYWAKVLTEQQLTNWAKDYPFVAQNKRVGIVMAGNIPLVGLHDLLCVLISGNQAVVKLSSKDHILMQFVIDALVGIDSELENNIELAQQLNQIDAVIATGSNNTARYFEHYFGAMPNIIRKNRTSVAVLNGNETAAQLKQLGSDIFSFYGLGCRNVTQLLVPKGYDFSAFFESMYEFRHSINHHKYANNYHYNRTIFLMNNDDFLDNHFLLLKRSNQLFSPIAVVNYWEYQSGDDLQEYINQQTNNIQCITGDYLNSVALGQSQSPKLDDYADGVDTLAFLTTL